MDVVALRVAEAVSDQTPQVVGPNADHHVFGIVSPPIVPYTLAQRDGNVVRLPYCGTAHGIGEGARYAVYPQPPQPSASVAASNRLCRGIDRLFEHRSPGRSPSRFFVSAPAPALGSWLPGGKVLPVVPSPRRRTDLDTSRFLHRRPRCRRAPGTAHARSRPLSKLSPKRRNPGSSTPAQVKFQGAKSPNPNVLPSCRTVLRPSAARPS